MATLWHRALRKWNQRDTDMWAMPKRNTAYHAEVKELQKQEALGPGIDLKEHLLKKKQEMGPPVPKKKKPVAAEPMPAPPAPKKKKPVAAEPVPAPPAPKKKKPVAAEPEPVPPPPAPKKKNPEGIPTVHELAQYHNMIAKKNRAGMRYYQQKYPNIRNYG